MPHGVVLNAVDWNSFWISFWAGLWSSSIASLLTGIIVGIVIWLLTAWVTNKGVQRHDVRL